MNPQPDEISVAIIICSRQRPELLTRALGCLARLTLPERCALRFAVVENDENPAYGEIIKSFGKTMDIEHIIAPEPGLSRARNKALETAIAMKVDWLGSVDDDQIIDPEWLVHMVGAIRKYQDTDMFVGQWRRTVPENTPKWHPPNRPPNKAKTGTLIKNGAGGNTIFHARVFSPDAMALRFDDRFNASGGEDSEFGTHYLAKGGKIRHVLEAITTEEIHPDRQSISARATRTMWAFYNMAANRHMHSYPVIVYLIDVQTVYRGLVLAAVNFMLGGFSWPISEPMRKNRIAMGQILFAQVQGVIRFHFGKSGGLYQNPASR